MRDWIIPVLGKVLLNKISKSSGLQVNRTTREPNRDTQELIIQLYLAISPQQFSLLSYHTLIPKPTPPTPTPRPTERERGRDLRSQAVICSETNNQKSNLKTKWTRCLGIASISLLHFSVSKKSFIRGIMSSTHHIGGCTGKAV